MDFNFNFFLFRTHLGLIFHFQICLYNLKPDCQKNPGVFMYQSSASDTLNLYSVGAFTTKYCESLPLKRFTFSHQNTQTFGPKSFLLAAHILVCFRCLFDLPVFQAYSSLNAGGSSAKWSGGVTGLSSGSSLRHVDGERLVSRWGTQLTEGDCRH